MDPDVFRRETTAAMELAQTLDVLQLQPAKWRRRLPVVPWYFLHPVTDDDLMWLYWLMEANAKLHITCLIRGRHIQKQYPLDTARLEAAWRLRGRLQFRRDPHLCMRVNVHEKDSAGGSSSNNNEAASSNVRELGDMLQQLIPEQPLRPLEFVYLATSLYHRLSPGIAGGLLSVLLGPGIASRNYDKCMGPLIHAAANPPPPFCHEILHMLWISYVAEAELILQDPPKVLTNTAPTNKNPEGGCEVCGKCDKMKNTQNMYRPCH